MVPSLSWFVYAFVRKEAVVSSQIEGTQATLVDLLNFETGAGEEPPEDPDLREICNYLEALDFARDQLRSGVDIAGIILDREGDRVVVPELVNVLHGPSAICRAVVASSPPDRGAGEINDKGHLVQSRCLANNADLVTQLYDAAPAAGIITLSSPTDEQDDRRQP